MVDASNDKVRKDAAFWIKSLGLALHPEGGYYKETYRAEGVLAASALPEKYEGDRNFATSIYFLLESHQCSKLHRINSDEIWYYHAGDAVNVHQISEEGKYSYQKLGPDLDKGESFQCIVPAGTWFGASIDNLFGFSLFGCMVAPGFDFSDFELAKREDLLEKYPTHELIIKTLT